MLFKSASMMLREPRGGGGPVDELEVLEEVRGLPLLPLLLPPLPLRSRSH